MAVNLVQQGSGRSVASTNGVAATQALPGAATAGAGRYLVAVCSFGFNFGGACTGFTVTDSLGNTYSEAAFINSGSSNAAGVYFAPITTGGSVTVSALQNIPTGTNDGRSAVKVYEIEAVDGTTPLDLVFEIVATNFPVDLSYTSPTLATAS